MTRERRNDWTDLMGHGRDAPRILWARRTLAIPLYLILLALMLGLAPVLFPLALLVDLLRSSPLVLTRFLAFLLLYLGCEAVGILASFLLWLTQGPWISRNTEAYLSRNFALQCWWARTLAGGAFRLFSIHLEVEGLEDFRDRPILLFVRHVSTADTVLPALLIGVPQRIMLRYVIKRELLLDPCLDIVGNRLPNYFAKRGSHEKEKEIQAVARLMDHLEPGQGVLTYPEGTRFTKAKREKILRRLEETGRIETLERARKMPCVLPPRPGGPLALLEKNRGADAVFCAHTGLETMTSMGQLWRGDLVHSRVHVKFWIVPYGDIPTGRDALTEWLWEHWARVNAFVQGNEEA